MSDISRIEIIARILKETNAHTYVEIGVKWGTVFLPMKARRKIGIDPAFRIPLKEKWLHIKGLFKNKYYKMTSDEFFDTHSRLFQKHKIDVAFIDGLHSYAQSLKDVNNCLTHLQEKGIIVLHDCNPTSDVIANPSFEAAKKMKGWKGFWCGDVWKSIVYLRSNRPDLYVTVLDCDFGIGLVTRGKPGNTLEYSPEEIDMMEYGDLNNNREKMLNLKHPDYLDTFLKHALK